uniref:Phospholipid phosphatase 2 n=1 Tax=Lates calcarifer TaxID=8187 RepID=A0A4W6E1I9_LATCA
VGYRPHFICLQCVSALPSAILTLMFSPYQRGIYCDDESISYPYRRDTISHGTMAAVTITCSIVILYVQARMQGKWTRLVRPTIQFFLIAFAVYVGYTRVSDYKHHWSDVLVGLLQGALIAVLNVRYVSDFFKERPPPCMGPDTAEVEHLERKPSPQPPDSQHGNHYNYSGPV